MVNKSCQFSARVFAFFILLDTFWMLLLCMCKYFLPLCHFLTLYMEPFDLQVFYLIRFISISFMVPRFCVSCLSYARVIKVLAFLFITYFQSFKTHAFEIHLCECVTCGRDLILCSSNYPNVFD